MLDFIDRLVAKHIFKQAVQGVQMNGWKTKTAGIAAILFGLGTIAKAISDGSWNEAQEGIAAAIGGLGMLGVGHKLDKVAAALKDS